jgi:LysR family transcriptional activator of nhaA
MIHFNYHHLYYFYAVARAGSISKACETLLLAQPTVSAQIKQFESHLKKQLFSRDGPRLSLTDEGRIVLDYAESIFELGREMEDTLGDLPKRGRAAIQVGIMTGTPPSFGFALLKRLLQMKPTVRLTVKQDNLENLLEELRHQRLDLILTDFAIRSKDQDEFNNQLVGRIPVVFAASSSLARKYRNLPSDLNGAPFILPSTPSQIYNQLQDLFAQWNIKPHIVAEVQDVELSKRLAQSGEGIIALNSYSILADTHTNKLSIMRTPQPLGVFESVYLVTKKRKHPNQLAERLTREFRLPSRG